MKDITSLLRPNIAKLIPYSSARDEYTGAKAVFLDANENPFNAPYNRYPDPYQQILKERIAELKEISAANLFLGNGSDEPIDLLFRAFAEPGKDNVIMIDPSYGMYQVAADINNIQTRKVLLSKDFQLNVEALLEAADANTKLLFLCSPNNPTGNCFPSEEIIKIIDGFNGIVVLDEAYIDFAPEKSLLPQLLKYKNLIILQTFSKAWGMAGIRLGMAFASQEIIRVLSKIKYPYNLNILTQEKALKLLEKPNNKEQWVEIILKERDKIAKELQNLPFINKIFPSDANFLLVKAQGAKKIYDFLVENQIIIRDRSKVSLCEGCLRITIGSEEENAALLKGLAKYNQ